MFSIDTIRLDSIRHLRPLSYSAIYLFVCLVVCLFVCLLAFSLVCWHLFIMGISKGEFISKANIKFKYVSLKFHSVANQRAAVRYEPQIRY